jgi:hypothetical protein
MKNILLSATSLVLLASSPIAACPALEGKTPDATIRYSLCSEGLYDRRDHSFVFRIQFNGLRMGLNPSYGTDIYFKARDQEYANQELSLFVDEKINPILLFRRKELQELNTFPFFGLVYVVAESMLDENMLAVGKRPDPQWLTENCSRSEGRQICNVSYIKSRTNLKAYYVIDSDGRVKNITISYQ